MPQSDRDRQFSHNTRRFLGLGGIALSLIIILSIVFYSMRTHLIPRLSISSTIPGSQVIIQPVSNCKTPPHISGDSNSSITSGGVKRTFMVHLAPSYGRDPQPLVINYHAYSYTAQQFAQYTDMAAEANKASFILVYPQGVDQPPSWNAGIGALGPTGDADDVQFTQNLLTYLEKNYCVDSHRVYVAGFSLGGGMAYRVACALTDQITAIATVAGAFYSVLGGCHPSRPIPVLEIHGQADHFAPYGGNPTMGMAAVQVYLNLWLNEDGCNRTNKTFFQQGDVTGKEWTFCASNTAVIQYSISDGGHTWPGAGPNDVLGYTTHVIAANTVIWDFFHQYKS